MGMYNTISIEKNHFPAKYRKNWDKELLGCFQTKNISLNKLDHYIISDSGRLFLQREKEDWTFKLYTGELRLISNNQGKEFLEFIGWIEHGILKRLIFIDYYCFENGEYNKLKWGKRLPKKIINTAL